MITLLPRNEIARTKKLISAWLTQMQQSFFDDEVLQYYIDDNEEHLYREQFDFIDGKIIDNFTKGRIIGLQHSAIQTFTKVLSGELTTLLTRMGGKEFLICSHLKLDLFGNRENEYGQLQDAYTSLGRITGADTYKEAFLTDLQSLPEFIRILFWITRCDPSAPEYLFFFDKQERFCFFICKYGNIHLTELSEGLLTDDELRSLGWTIIEGRETDNFTDDGAIPGRELKM